MADDKDLATLQQENRENAQKRLEENPSTAPDRGSETIGWTAQQGYAPLAQSDDRQRYAKWQLPDPEAAKAAGLPVLEIPENLILEDEDDDQFYGQRPEERVTDDEETLLEQHPGDVPRLVAVKESGPANVNVEPRSGTDIPEGEGEDDDDDDEGGDTTPSEGTAEDDSDLDQYATGGGWYEINGNKVQGKEAARAELNK